MKWNSSLYDQQHDFVSRYGEDLIALLAPRQGEYIADIGCGTGDLAAIISSTGATVTGIDHSPEMIARAEKKYPGIRFQVQSAENFTADQPLDAVFSNATLHWVLHAERAARCICQSLKTNGRLVAELGGKGNVAGITSALKAALISKGYPGPAAKQVWYFPSLAQYCMLLEQQGFRVVLAAHFNRDTLLKNEQGIRNWIAQFGQPYLQEVPAAAAEAIITAAEEQLRPTHYRDGNWYADYVRLRVVAIKQ